MIIEGLLGSVNSPFDASNGAIFDGTNDYMSEGGGSLITTNDTAILSFWFRKLTEIHDEDIIGTTFTSGTLPCLRLYIHDTNNTLWLQTQASGGGFLRNAIVGDFSDYEDGLWHHYLASWDNGNILGSVYIDDVKKVTISSGSGLDTVGIPGDFNIGVDAAKSGSNRYDGDLAEFYYNDHSSFVDMDIKANRRKFITSSARPVDLGSDGSTPTGAAPEVFLKGNGSGFNVNSGTGGNFTITGSLGTPTDSPSNP